MDFLCCLIMVNRLPDLKHKNRVEFDLVWRAQVLVFCHIFIVYSNVKCSFDMLEESPYLTG